MFSVGDVQIAAPVFLAPMSGVTDAPARTQADWFGAPAVVTEMVAGAELARERVDFVRRAAPHNGSGPFIIQLAGREPEWMRIGAELSESAGADIIDINMGCPAKKVTGGQSGCALMREPELARRLIAGTVAGTRRPVTVKMRLGWDAQNITAPFFARAFEQVGVAAIAIHGRTRAQGFSGAVDRQGIRQVVEAVSRIPVIGNGDVRTVADAEQMLRETGCAGVSIGRGALANPWIFRQLQQWEETGRFDPPGDFDARLELLRRQFEYVIELRGPERAIPFFRKMAHWYLKAMRVSAALRHRLQTVQTRGEFHEALQEISDRGPAVGSRTDLPDMHIAVPAGPVEHW